MYTMFEITDESENKTDYKTSKELVDFLIQRKNEIEKLTIRVSHFALSNEEWKTAKRIKDIGRPGCHNSCIVSKRALYQDAENFYWNVGFDSQGVIKDEILLNEAEAKKYLGN